MRILELVIMLLLLALSWFMAGHYREQFLAQTKRANQAEARITTLEEHYEEMYRSEISALSKKYVDLGGKADRLGAEQKKFYTRCVPPFRHFLADAPPPPRYRGVGGR